ncbi:hypothetical protein [Tunturiibacter gelidiferens]|uniref:hypothetical protein n=1 Tax=Tunturiibacter gelidiferens TaxID=3069689 RepID=UPI003D9B851E
MDQPWTASDVRQILTNPNYCLSNPPVITEEKWIEAGVKLISVIGPEQYLWMVLDHLKRS